MDPLIGKKLELNKSYEGIAEVIGMYPKGQGDYTETHYEIMISGYRIKLAAPAIKALFTEIDPTKIELEVKEIKPVEKVIEEAKEVIKSKGKGKK